MAQRAVDKIITKAAREILRPVNLFQVGASRLWIDDNDWFLSVVEFQPSSWSQGAYLNVAISFLWNQGPGFAEVLPYNIGGRQLAHIPYKGNDETFYQCMLKMSLQAKDKVLEYRALFGSPSAAAEQIETYRDANNPLGVVSLWNQAMGCYLFGEETAGDSALQNLLLVGEKESRYVSGGKEFTRDWVVRTIEDARSFLACKEKKKTVVDSIVAKRNRLRGKSSYKRLPVSPQYL